MAVRKLFIKEFRSIFPVFGIFSLIVVLLHFFILYKSNVWDEDLIFVMSIVLPLTFAGVIAVGAGYYQLHVEWKTNTIYFLLSLPVRGWKVLSTKLAAVLILFIMTMIWIGVSFTLILLRTRLDEWLENEDISEILPTLLNVMANGFWMICLLVLLLLIVIQFAFLCGELVSKFKWLVVISAFIAALYLVLRISPFLSNMLQWGPEIFYGDSTTDGIYLHSGPFIICILISIGLVWLNGYIFEQEVEV